MPTADRGYPPLNRGLYRFVKGVFAFLFRILTRVHVEGVENVPQQGGVIMVSNHLSYIDSPAIFIVFPRILHVLAAEKYEQHPIFGPLLRVAGAIFIDRGEADRDAIRQAVAVLMDGHCLAVAAEGTRSKTGGLQPGKTGAAYFAVKAEVPLVPTVVWGTQGAVKKAFTFQRPHLYIRFGKPIHLPEGRARSDQLEQYTDQIMIALARLLPEQYRGVYHDRPEVLTAPSGGIQSAEA
jgi:1-acyl-sn-glycerol-3-phosphate acyltransferase